MKTYNKTECYNNIFSPVKIFTILVMLSLGIMLFSLQANAQGVKPINSYIPDSFGEKLDVKLELRYRFESRENFDFYDSNNDKDDFHLFRSRLNINYDPLDNVHAFVQLQDARIFESDFGNKTAFEDNVDIRQAYIDIKNSAESLLTFRIGRQELFMVIRD